MENTTVKQDLDDIKKTLKNMSVLVCDIIHHQLNDIDKQMNEKLESIKNREAHLEENKKIMNKRIGQFAKEKYDRYVKYSEEELEKAKNEVAKLHDRYIDLFLAMEGLTENNEEIDISEEQ